MAHDLRNPDKQGLVGRGAWSYLSVIYCGARTVIRGLLKKLTGRKKLNEDSGIEVEGLGIEADPPEEFCAEMGYATLETTDEHRTNLAV